MFLPAAASPAIAGEAVVTAVEAAAIAPGAYRFEVTISHQDEGWDHYVDKWEVLAPDGRVLGRRELLHPHVDEQPFTRSLDGVDIPSEIDRVTIRAHDSVHGHGRGMSVDLPR